MQWSPSVLADKVSTRRHKPHSKAGASALTPVEHLQTAETNNRLVVYQLWPTYPLDNLQPACTVN